MRLLHIVPTLSIQYGGPVQASLDMAMVMADRGHQVTIYSIDHYRSHNLVKQQSISYELNEIKVTEFKASPICYRGLSIELFKTLLTSIKQYDLVHIHELYLISSLVAGEICRRHNIPYVFQPHGSLDPYIVRRRGWRKAFMWPLAFRRFIRSASAIYYTTDEEMRLANQNTLSVPSYIIPLGISLENYRPLPKLGVWRRRMAELNDKRVIVFLGRLHPKKGIDILVKAFAIASQHRNDLHLVLAGPDNDYQQQIEKWVIEQRIESRVTFTGIVTGNDKLALLQDADLFVLSSYSENFGITVIEAMACGLPVLISDQVNIWREVVDGGAGRVARCDVDHLSATMLEMLGNTEQLRQQGECGIELVKRKFSWPVIATRLERAYQTIAERSRLTPGSGPSVQDRSKCRPKYVNDT